jgi:hypothetical protein
MYDQLIEHKTCDAGPRFIMLAVATIIPRAPNGCVSQLAI